MTYYAQSEQSPLLMHHHHHRTKMISFGNMFNNPTTPSSELAKCGTAAQLLASPDHLFSPKRLDTLAVCGGGNYAASSVVMRNSIQCHPDKSIVSPVSGKIFKCFSSPPRWAGHIQRLRIVTL